MSSERMPSELPIADAVEVGLMAGFASYGQLADTVGLLDETQFDSLWVGDHIAFTSPIFDPLLQLAQAAALSPRLKVGTAIYLLPLRPAAIAAKQAVSLDHLTEGRFVFGGGVGGECGCGWAPGRTCWDGCACSEAESSSSARTTMWS